MAEWLKAAVLKTATRYPRVGGSNPPPSVPARRGAYLLSSPSLRGGRRGRGGIAMTIYTIGFAGKPANRFSGHPL